MTKRLRRTNAERLSEAFDCHSDLHVLAAIQLLCEASLFRSVRGKRLARRILRACEAERRALFLGYEHERIRTEAILIERIPE